MDKQEKAIWFVAGFGTMSLLVAFIGIFITWFTSNKIKPGDLIELNQLRFRSDKSELYENKVGIVVGITHNGSDTYYKVYPVKLEDWKMEKSEQPIRKMNYVSD